MLAKVAEHLVQGPCHKQGFRRKIQAAIGEYDELLALIKKPKQVIWSHTNAFSLSNDYFTGHSEGKEDTGYAFNLQCSVTITKTLCFKPLWCVCCGLNTGFE